MSPVPAWTARRRDPVTARAGDWALATVLVLLHLLAPRTGLADTGASSIAAGIATLFLAVGQGLPLVWRRKHPRAVAGCVLLCYAGTGILVGLVPPFSAWVLIWSFGSRPPGRRGTSLTSLAMLTAGSTGVLVVLAEVGRTGSGAWALYLFVTAVITLGAVLLASERGRLEAVRQRGATEERLRIASDLHDLVGHGLSAVAVQSSTARMALEAGDSPTARAALSAIEATSRTAMREMRQMLGVLRGADGEVAELPAPGLGDIETLVENVRSGGIAVVTELDDDLGDLGALGALRGIAPATQLCAYRVVQEGLTNAVKHAPGALVTVRITHDGESLGVRVVTSGAAAAPPTSEETGGLGLSGLRTRVGAAGGELRSGPTADGWLLEARLPSQEEGTP